MRTGLPTQMTEMHKPVRALFIVEAPLERVNNVLKRRKDLLRLVKNEWVNFVVKDPHSLLFFKYSHCLSPLQHREEQKNKTGIGD